MKLESKFDIGDVVYIKNSAGVSKGTIQALSLDPAQQKCDSFTFVYLVWESDRKDNAGHHIWVYEDNVARSFDEAYYEAKARFPWDITEDLRVKDMIVHIAKMRSSDSSIVPKVI